ncbi:MAG TPA: hypothetical protein VFN67_16740, partial [Polyangiales bacterium]|nr:hypothetical protein [Polyangiales bacterium]
MTESEHVQPMDGLTPAVGFARTIRATGTRARQLSSSTLSAVLVGALCVLVIVRCWAFVVEGAHFDSDQAVVGLMGLDLAEGRAIAWFTYGRRYMLAIGAWLCAPLFALFGTSVMLLKLPLAVLNLGLMVMLWRGLRKTDQLTPSQTFISILPMALPGVVTSSRLVEQGGGNIEPFLFLVGAFLLRNRPVLLGLTLGVGFLNREFTLIGLIALFLLDLVQGRLLFRWRAYLVTGALTYVTNAVGRWLALYSPNFYGPEIEVGSYSRESIAGLLKAQLPMVLGARETAVGLFNIPGALTVGHTWLYGLFAVWLALTIVVLAIVQRAKLFELDGLAAYLVVVAAGQGLAFVLFCPDPLNPMLIRYVLVLLLGVVGAVALAMKRPSLKGATIALVTLLTLANLTDNVALARHLYKHPPEDDRAVLARELVRRGIRYAEAEYWIAYHVSFLSGERVVVTAPQDARIKRYRKLIAAH